MIPMDNVVALQHNDQTCRLAPGCGGSLLSWSRIGAQGPVDLLRPADPTRAVSPTDSGCFPLVPFSNRIAAGRFTFQGRAVTLPHDPGFLHAIHGHGWTRAWTVEDRSTRALRLALHHSPDAWPWRYSAHQTIALEDDGLSIRLELLNESDETMPAGFGLHPYFPKPPGTRITMRVGGVWDNDSAMLPHAHHPLPPSLSFPDGLILEDSVVLDHGFTGWDGRAAIQWTSGPTAGTTVTLLADGPFGHVIVYAPAGENYLCLEPVSHMTNALNRPDVDDAGVIALAPGERVSGTLRFRLSSF